MLSNGLENMFVLWWLDWYFSAFNLDFKLGWIFNKEKLLFLFLKENMWTGQHEGFCHIFLKVLIVCQSFTILPKNRILIISACRESWRLGSKWKWTMEKN